MSRMGVEERRITTAHATPPLLHLRLRQVTADFTAPASSSLQGGGGGPSLLHNHNSEAAVQPALGLSWANCVHSRFLLTRRDGAAAGAGSSHFVRQMRLVLSPTQPSDLSCRFVVEAAGVRGVPPAGGGEQE